MGNESRGLMSPSSPVCPVRAGIIVFAPVAPVVQFVWLGRWLTDVHVCCLRPSSPVCPVRALTAGIASYTDLQAVATSRGLMSPSSPVCPVRAGIIVFAPVAPVVQFVWLGRWLTDVPSPE